jgi:hypothetical protein
MRKLLVLILVAAVAGLGIWYALRKAPGLQASNATVTALLPKETLAFFYVPDVKRTREHWHETDLYKLWREPAMQDFMQKPLARIPRAGGAHQKLQDMTALEMKDAFLAVTSFENQEPKVLAGFRFKGSAAEAEKVIGPWRTRLQERMPTAKKQSIAYQGHQIEVMTANAMTAATVYDRSWFFAANDVADLKALLDRADKRVKDAATTFSADENFIAASKHMPASYEAFGYARLDRYMKKLADKMPPDSSGNEQVSVLRQIRSLAAATTFRDGKVRDVLFVGMPKLKESGELTRSSLSLATKDTFFYLASFLNLPERLNLPDPHATNASTGAMPGGWQRFLTGLGSNGLTLQDWTSAFASELGVVGAWTENARMPNLFATVSVKDAAKARQVLEKLTATATEEARPWTSSEKDGVVYYSQAPANPMMPMSTTIALSPRLLVAGLDADSVEGAIRREGAGSSELATAENFKTAEGWVPTPKYSFTYLDLPLLYTRLDATVRPMLVMAAAFVPKIAQTVDLGKLPAAEVITKHLSPLVMSQSYVGDGYVAESVGPVSIYEAALGAIAATGAGAAFYQQQTHGGLGIQPPPSAPPTSSTQESPEPTEESPSPTPEPTP